MIELPQQNELKPYRRSPLLIAAYWTMGIALVLLVLGPGMIWIMSAVGMAVLLALVELFLRLKRRGPSA